MKTLWVIAHINRMLRQSRCICSRTGLFEMKEYASLYWKVVLYLALSTICVTANKLNVKSDKSIKSMYDFKKQMKQVDDEKCCQTG